MIRIASFWPHSDGFYDNKFVPLQVYYKAYVATLILFSKALEW